MGGIVALLFLVPLAIWCLRRWQDTQSLPPPPSPSPLPPPSPLQLTESTADASKPMGGAALTADDVIRFGLALEASDDVVSELVADSG